MSQKIGYQDGLDGLINFLRKFPLVKYRPVGDRPSSLEQWYWLETGRPPRRILKDAHASAIVGPSPVPPAPQPVPPPSPARYLKVAPRVAYKQGSSDARYCTREQPGVVQEPNAPRGHTTDES